MNEDVKRLWVDALRSGDYKQGRHALNKDGAFCCLGVLCEIAHKLGVVSKKQYENVFLYDDDSLSLPLKVSEWSELESQYELASMNDRGESFTQIADYIENIL